MRWLLGILINAVLFIAFAGYFSGFEVSGFGAAITASLVLSILNMLVRPILIILTLPATILTLGLFLFVINAITLMLTDAIMGSKFEIRRLWASFSHCNHHVNCQFNNPKNDKRTTKEKITRTANLNRPGFFLGNVFIPSRPYFPPAINLQVLTKNI